MPGEQAILEPPAWRPPFASRLQAYDFGCVGPLWNTTFQPEPAIYAFVAPNGIKRYFEHGIPQQDGSYVVEFLPADDDEVDIAPSKIFYIGSATNLYSRIVVHKNKVSKRGSPVATMLHAARWKHTRVDVYVRHVPRNLVTVHGLPVDLLRGCERGLIRELRPRGNAR